VRPNRIPITTVSGPGGALRRAVSVLSGGGVFTGGSVFGPIGLLIRGPWWGVSSGRVVISTFSDNSR
jgi:hypothetical protein